jgi:predicted HAD superfamily Cof-like phosphohydrolase
MDAQDNSNVVAGNKTNFDKVNEFNRAFDMVPLTPETYTRYYVTSDDNVKRVNPCAGFRFELISNSPNVIKLRLDLIKEEISELNDAIKNNDFIETRDAIADILYVVYGMADVLGFDINILFNIKYINTFFGKYMVDIINLINNFTENGLLNDNISLFSKVKTILQINQNIFLEIEKEYLSIPEILQHLHKKINLTYNSLENLTLKYLDYKDIEDYSYTIICEEILALLKWVYSYAAIAGINADADFDIVHNSNMSKLCSNEEEAIATVEDYIKKFENGSSPYDSPYYYHLPAIGKWIVKNKSTGKALKNINYIKVDFSK